MNHATGSAAAVTPEGESQSSDYAAGAAQPPEREHAETSLMVRLQTTGERKGKGKEDSAGSKGGISSKSKILVQVTYVNLY